MTDNSLTKGADVFRIAAKKGRTIWLQKLLVQLLPELDHADADYYTWFDSLIDYMKERGLVEPIQQKDYLSDVRRGNASNFRKASR